MGKSLAQIVAELPEEERAAVLADIDSEELMYDWSFWGRPEQILPDDDWNVYLALAGRGFGKLVDIHTPIRCNTELGWKAIGDIEAGDEIFDENGKICLVLQAHEPEVPEKMYRLTFSDGATVDAGGEHQWVTWTHADRKSYTRSDTPRQRTINDTSVGYPDNWVTWTRHTRWGHSTGVGPKVRTTDEIVETFTYGKRGDRNHSIPLARSLDLPEAKLPIHPRLLGTWLGDGTASSGTITHHRNDVPEILHVIESAGYTAKVRYKKVESPDVANILVDGLSSDLRKLGLINNKHIPRAYLNASIAQRKELLAGLLDTDGTIGENGIVEFCSVIPELAHDTLELVRSLGEKPTLKQSESRLYGVRKKDRYRLTWRPLFNPFKYKRKSDRFRPLGAQASRNYHRMLVSYEEIEPTLSRCLTVDSPNSMYLVGEAMVPTHNTRMAAEWVRELAKDTREGPKRIGLVARTAADARDILVEGESGILAVTPPSERPLYEPSKRRLTWPSGSTATTFSADEPDSLRGVQFHASLSDEAAAWRQSPDAAGMTAFDNLRVATRLGRNPKILITTTPKRVPLLYSLLAEHEKNPEKVRVVRGSTMDNAGNLAESYIDAITGVYAGTRLAQQELYGEMLDAVEGALWTDELIENYRVDGAPSALPLRCVAVDPSVAESPKDECGIVVVGSTAESDLYRRQSWVLEDASVLGAPSVWAERVVAMARKWGCPVVAEVNQGGALVKAAIHTIDPNVKVLEVHSKNGKALRAEPVTLAYEQGRVHHVGFFAELESQMTSWMPGEGKSPDRIDALVHGLTALLIKPPTGFTGGRITARSSAGRRMNLGRASGGRGGFRVR